MPLALDPELAQRLMRTYRLAKPPSTLEEYAALSRDRIAASPELRAFFRRVERGEAVIGETSVDRGQRFRGEGGSEVRVMCGYDALATALLRGSGTVLASCPHCGESIVAAIEKGRLEEASPPAILFWFGDGPRGIPVCDHLNLFPDHAHLEAWLATNPEELGVPLPLPEAVALIAKTFEGL